MQREKSDEITHDLSDSTQGDRGKKREIKYDMWMRGWEQIKEEGGGDDQKQVTTNYCKKTCSTERRRLPHAALCSVQEVH